MGISVDSSQTNLNNLIENNHLFSPSSPSSGEKHPGFHPNIHMPSTEEARHEGVIAQEKHINHEEIQAQIQQGNLVIFFKKLQRFI